MCGMASGHIDSPIEVTVLLVQTLKSRFLCPAMQWTFYKYILLLIEQLIDLRKWEVTENWGLKIWKRSSKSSNGWLLSNTVDDCLQR